MQKGGMHRLRVIDKRAISVIFGFIWKGHITATCEDYEYSQHNGLYYGKREYEDYRVVGNRICLDTREVVMVTDFHYREGVITFKAWGKESFAFLKFPTSYYKLIEVTEFTEDLRSPNF